MIIKIDSRELDLYNLCKRESKDIDYLEVIQETLLLGDAIIYDKDNNEQIIIERKTLRDLASSIIDGRYNEQSFRLNQIEIPNHNIIYLIEGNLFHYKPISRISKSALLSSMITLNYVKGFSVFRTFNIQETAEYILKFTEKLKKESKSEDKSTISYTSVVKRAKKDQITEDNIGEIMLCQIPGVSHNSAHSIMTRYSNLYELITNLTNTPDCLDDLKINNRKISKTCIQNIKIFLLHSKQEN